MAHTVSRTSRLGAGLIVLALLGTGCSFWSNDDVCNEDRYERKLSTLRAQIDAEIGDAEASDVASCRTLPLGDKPCGGPWTYLVYSTEVSDADDLRALAEEYDRIDRARNRACELVSTCDVTPEPNVAIQGGRCIAVYGGVSVDG